MLTSATLATSCLIEDLVNRSLKVDIPLDHTGPKLAVQLREGLVTLPERQH